MFNNRISFAFLFFVILFSCKDSVNEDFARKIISVEYFKELSRNWDVNQSSDNVIEFSKLDNGGLKSGESLFFCFYKPKSIEYLEFTNIDTSFFAYKVYLDDKFVGKAESNLKVGIGKKANSVRVSISKKVDEVVVFGWDRYFDYVFVKDTTKVTKQVLKVKLSEQKEKVFKSFPQKRNQLSKVDIKGIPLNFAEKRCVLYQKSKKKNWVVQQAVNFNIDGSFYIDYTKARKKSKEVLNQYYLVGSWRLLEKGRNRIKIEIEANFSGSKSQNSLFETSKYHKVVVIDSLNIIRSNDFLDGTMMDLPNHVMVNLRPFSKDFIIDIPYSTIGNITGQKLYDCNECYLLYQTVKDLLKVKDVFKQKGFRVKLLDCYRPFAVQKILYEAFPVSGYVADPVGGSIHNRGTAVDLTIVDSFGNELDMGSEYDDLTIRSNHGYIGFSDTILQNRKLLRETMEACNFVTIRLEWWHYNHQYARRFPKLNDPFPCSTTKN